MKKYSRMLALVLLPVLLFSAWRVFGVVEISKNIEQEDIFFSFREGQRILNGENPYDRILSGNMRDNDKYATYFPMFYEFSYVTQAQGLQEFPAWLLFWRRVFVAACLGVAVLLFYVFWRYDMEWIGIFAAAFWLFNRWTLTVISIVHLDFLPIFFLVASLIVFPKNRWLGLLLYGVSLALKQIGIFILPLYLIWTWFAVEKNRIKEVLTASALIGIIPLLASVPFLVRNAQSFLMSIMFSATRADSGRFTALTLDGVLGWEGIIGRLPMLLLFGFVYWLCISRRVGRYTGAFLVMSVFIGFNTALFLQYLLWLVPLTSMLLLDPKEKYSMLNGGV